VPRDSKNTHPGGNHETTSSHCQLAHGTGTTAASGEPTATRTTGRLDLTVSLAMHDAFRRDLAHLARAAARHHGDLEDRPRPNTVYFRLTAPAGLLRPRA
jgi:hypothetical protein